ncbi:aromatic ring-hydroxylating dioxygenase subunit alpha [Pseudomonas aeruginosa]|uniref:aromatic ring-hydroxylating dioxygenase subunit alpha n=1 Tax=Pseudomonas aeruginosa TaxID=287 RepID=UPI002B48F3CD|nr:aromatic ring-hydroxylating dioxygenase subunit alpha [Pseudomonas aeruginosa]MEB3081517.1 aromatic ring-hydroxylating dioxygenase subunit alpha [Pseudomonas aeruginosa]MEB3142973.1 aromatic ring-hydroxylating dioxygenase subunit alpha [Pseudomonas aeruginosa]
MSKTSNLRLIASSAPLSDLDRICDMEAGRMAGKMFWDKDIYEQELEKIFARCWLFVAHESQIPRSGDYLSTTMGEDEVLVVRQKDGSIKVLINACPHRGNKVCFAEAGNARGFICNYHGWAFGPDGALRGMHESGVYEQGAFERGQQGLREVAQVGVYKGLVFANFDPQAPSLAEYLGPMTWYLDVLLDNDEGGTEFIGGCIRSTIECNWKIAAENFVGDILHAGWTHDSAAQAMLGGSVTKVSDFPESYQVNWNGHGYEFARDLVGNAAVLGESAVNKYLHLHRPRAAERLGEFRAAMMGAVSSFTVFPNFSFLPGQNTVRVWQPRGPDKIELYTWVIVNKNAPQEVKDKWRRGAMMTFSPTGVFEMDDGENWEYCTKTNRGLVTRYQDLYVGLGMHSRIEDSELPGNVFRGQLNEANARAFYQRWKDLLQAPSWADMPDRNGKLS